jgi:hypothetical protein
MFEAASMNAGKKLCFGEGTMQLVQCWSFIKMS